MIKYVKNIITNYIYIYRSKMEYRMSEFQKKFISSNSVHMLMRQKRKGV